MDDLFVFGDDFEAILGILEEDEAMEEEFTAVASDVCKKKLLSLACILAALKYSLRRNKLYSTNSGPPNDCSDILSFFLFYFILFTFCFLFFNETHENCFHIWISKCERFIVPNPEFV